MLTVGMTASLLPREAEAAPPPPPRRPAPRPGAPARGPADLALVLLPVRADLGRVPLRDPDVPTETCAEIRTPRSQTRRPRAQTCAASWIETRPPSGRSETGGSASRIEARSQTAHMRARQYVISRRNCL